MNGGMVQDFLTTPDDVRLAVYAAGPGDGPLLLLAGGLLGGVAAWRPLVERFAQRYRVVSWDYRGLYRSFPPAGGDYSLARHCDDLEAVLAWTGRKSAILAGWSVGAQVAIEVCRRRPDLVRALVLVNGCTGRMLSGDFAPSWLRFAAPWVLRALRRAGPGLALAAPVVLGSEAALAFARSAHLVSPTLDADITREILDDMVRLDPNALASTIAEMDAADVRDSLAGLGVPTLVLAGDHDRVTPPEIAHRMARDIPGAELLVIKGGSHLVPLEYPAVIGLRLEKFLRERVPGIGPSPLSRRSAGTSTRRPAGARSRQA